MTKWQKIDLGWFARGLMVSGLLMATLTNGGFPGIGAADYAAALVLGILATIQFGVIMPITCIYFRWKRDKYNFFHAFVFLIGFTLGTGVVISWYGLYVVAILYVAITVGILSVLYLLTFHLHRKMHETAADKNHPR